MPFFRKKPTAIEARQFDGSKESAEAIIAWIDNRQSCHFVDGGLNLFTLEGLMRVVPGAWVIQGVRGEFYACKEGIFAETYEEVIDENTWRKETTADLRKA